MKTSTKTKLLTLMAVSTLSVYNINAQTALSGNAAASNGCGAGNAGGATNTSVGCAAGASNTTGTKNTAVGDSAMYANTTVANAAFGYVAMRFNSTGANNTATGPSAMYKNTTGSGNTANGFAALSNNLSNNFSTAMGYEASLNSTGTYNTHYGAAAGRTVTNGAFNTCVGGNADVDSAGRFNASAFGYSAIAKKNNAVYLGNTAATNGVFAYGPYNNISDGRFKTNVQENVKGLEFINKLRPVTYNFNSEALDNFLIQNMSEEAKAAHKTGMNFKGSSSKVYSGFIAQEVEAASKAVGFKSAIVSAPSNSSDPYALNYAEIVVPLVKAVQEQQAMIEQQQQQINELKKLVAGGVTPVTPNSTNSTSSIKAQTMELSDAVVLNQNQPNPFAEQTLINYNVPQTANSAQILFYDLNGKQIKSQTITTKGQGALNVYANDLSSGTYSYTLLVDGKVIDTKKMIKQ